MAPRFKHPPVNRDALLRAIRKFIHSSDGRRVGIMEFMNITKIQRRNIYRLYPSWNEALTAAGFHFDPYNQRVEPDRLLADLGRVARKLRRAPNLREYHIHGKYHTGTMCRRFGSWINAHRAFRKFATGKPAWADVLACFPRLSATARSRGPLPGARRLPRRSRRPSYGARLGIPGMRNTPLNESGVIFLFGILAHTLGFEIESIRTAFPDCEAKRTTASGGQETVFIEFEYESRNFRGHGHPPAGCDIIVCWSHNWPDCPKSLEVIALSEKLAYLFPPPPAEPPLSTNSKSPPSAPMGYVRTPQIIPQRR